MTKMIKMEAQNDQRQLHTVFLVSLIDLFSVSLVIPILATHLISIGFSHFQIGMLGSVYSFMQLVSSPCIGSLSDVSGRKTVLGFSLVVCSACYFVLGYSDVYAVIFLARFTLGILKNTQSLCKTIIADVTPTDRQLGAYGMFTSITSLAFVVGPSLGGHIAELSNGFFYLCSIASLLFLLNAFIVFVYVHNSGVKTKTEEGKGVTFSQQVKLTCVKLVSIKWGKHYPVFLVRFFYGISIFMFFSSYTLYMKETFDMSPSAIGYTVSFQGMVSFLAGIMSKYISGAQSSITRCYYLLLLLSTSFFVLAFVQSFFAYLLFLVPMFVSYSLLRVVTIEMVFENSDFSERGSLNGAFNSVMSLSKLITPVISGFVIDRFGYKAVFFNSFLFCGLAALFCKLLCNDKKKIS